MYGHIPPGVVVEDFGRPCTPTTATPVRDVVRVTDTTTPHPREVGRGRGPRLSTRRRVPGPKPHTSEEDPHVLPLVHALQIPTSRTPDVDSSTTNPSPPPLRSRFRSKSPRSTLDPQPLGQTYKWSDPYSDTPES